MILQWDFDLFLLNYSKNLTLNIFMQFLLQLESKYYIHYCTVLNLQKLHLNRIYFLIAVIYCH
jgi:hypothetical protein